MLPEAPALSRWLSRAPATPFPATAAEDVVYRLLGGAPVPGTPVAALSYRYDFGRWPGRYCLRADPVHLRADTSGLILFDASRVRLDEAESRALADTLATHLAQDGWTLQVGHPERWYLLGDSTKLHTPALPGVRGTPVPVSAIGGDDASTWRNRLNEIQMLMYAHGVSQARAERGQPGINSVWLWGGGEKPDLASGRFDALVSDDPVALGAAQALSLPVRPAANAIALAGHIASGSHLLVQLDACRAAAAYEDVAAWIQALQALEEDWLAPLLADLRRGGVDELTLYPVNGHCYRLTRPRLRALWRRLRDYRRLPGFASREALRV